MKLCKIIAPLSLIRRNIQTAVAELNSQKSKGCVIQAISQEGIKYASLVNPERSNGLSRLVLIVNAGSRYERAPLSNGMSHLLRRSCGLSTDLYTSINLTRHVQQMGAQLQCQSTREHLIYSIDVAPNLASRAGYLLAHMASNSSFYTWELKDEAYKCMLKDIDLLNRRTLDALAIECLHEAAFGVHPDGSGLGNSLFASADRVGTFTLDEIHGFLRSRFTPDNIAFAVSGIGQSVDPLEICDTMKNALRFEISKPLTQDRIDYGFIGGEIRRNYKSASKTHAVLAWPTQGHAEAKSMLSLAVCSRILYGPIKNIAYSTTLSLLNPDDNCEHNHLACAGPLYNVYSDFGLFGIIVSGSCGQSVGQRITYATCQLIKLAENGLTKEQFERAKSRLKADILMCSESQFELTNDLAIQLLNKTGLDYQSPEDICFSVDDLQLSSVNSVLKSVVSSKKPAALSVVGADTSLTPPISKLLEV